MKKIMFTASVLCLVSMVFAADKVIHQDDFSNPKRYGQEWKRTDGSWKYDLLAKTLRQSIGAPHRVGKLYLNKELPADIEISCDFKYLGGKSMKGFGGGIVFRHPGVNKLGGYYQVGIATHGQSGLSVSKINTVNENGKIKNKYKMLGRFNSNVLEQGKKHNIKIRVEGNIITCWIDGEEMFEFEDKDKTVNANGNTFGFSTYGAAMDFDNLVIKEIVK